MFLGIPYAAPPIHERRWKPPEPVAPWTGVRKADAFPAACPQPSVAIQDGANDNREFSTKLPYYKEFRTGEDCLYLNVWTTNLAGQKKLPVMVWIHGDGGVAGTGQSPPLGPALARKGVVLATIDFRIGALGQLAHPALSAESSRGVSGNYGTLDQIAALQWIQRNIGRFGGDPGNVTIFGHSDGGTKVCVLLASPLGRGLFHRAILESEVCSEVVIPELKRAVRYEFSKKASSAEEIGLQLARNLKIADSADALKQLRAKTAQEIIEAGKNLDIAATDPTVEGWVLTEQPAVTFRTGRQTHVPVLTGSTDDETAFLYNPASDPSTLVAYKKWLGFFGGFAGQMFNTYPAHSDSDVRAAFIALNNDATSQGAYYFARHTIKAGSKAYLYYFTYPGRGKTAGLGAIHGSELKFLSGIFRDWWGPPTAEDQRLIGILGGYWTHFAANGDPNGPGLPAWPEFDTAERCLDIGREIKTRDVPHREKFGVFEAGLRARLDALQSAR